MYHDLVLASHTHADHKLSMVYISFSFSKPALYAMQWNSAQATLSFSGNKQCVIDHLECCGL